MKSIGKLKLTQLRKAELGKRELNKLVGGEHCCICGCRSGGSSTLDVVNANNRGGASGLYSPGGGVGTGSYS
ncbi:TIGR04149 family rSAM-modified RiPP [Parabacteroides hominis]|uniref:RSAM-modified peptide n=1 Tax=Parabacteroides hominis TaxID=2763057 RepID=A0ABR7DSI0_9BACT|nr:TIGR04149 family rSAM-modified RiPP [Parabacteroides hominis]MBC5633882.1 rSAM-modified peptide [Parabacteroides hominis]